MDKSDMEVMRLLQKCSGRMYRDIPLMRQAAADPSLSPEARSWARGYILTNGYEGATPAGFRQSAGKKEVED